MSTSRKLTSIVNQCLRLTIEGRMRWSRIDDVAWMSVLSASHNLDYVDGGTIHLERSRPRVLWVFVGRPIYLLTFKQKRREVAAYDHDQGLLAELWAAVTDDGGEVTPDFDSIERTLEYLGKGR